MGEDMGTSIRGENPAALPGKVLAHQIRTVAGKCIVERLNYFGQERGRPPWGAAPTAEPGRRYGRKKVMSVKIRVSYTDEEELARVVRLLSPLEVSWKRQPKKGKYMRAYGDAKRERSPNKP